MWDAPIAIAYRLLAARAVRRAVFLDLLREEPIKQPLRRFYNRRGVRYRIRQSRIRVNAARSHDILIMRANRPILSQHVALRNVAESFRRGIVTKIEVAALRTRTNFECLNLGGDIMSSVFLNTRNNIRAVNFQKPHTTIFRTRDTRSIVVWIRSIPRINLVRVCRRGGGKVRKECLLSAGTYWGNWYTPLNKR